MFNITGPQCQVCPKVRAEPGALVCEPLKAAAGSLTRPRKTTACRDILTCRGALPKLPGHPPCFKVRDVFRNPAVGTRRQRRGAIAFKNAPHYESPTRILRGLANFYCLPGRAGGSP